MLFQIDGLGEKGDGFVKLEYNMFEDLSRVRLSSGYERSRRPFRDALQFGEAKVLCTALLAMAQYAEDMGGYELVEE